MLHHSSHPTKFTLRTAACHTPLPGPIKARRSPVGDCPCPERGPQHNGLLVSLHLKRGAKPKTRNPSPPGHAPVHKAERGLDFSHHAPPHHGFSFSSPCTLVHEGETTLSIAHYLDTCQGKSYSGPIRLTPEIMVHVVHYNGMHPSLDLGEPTTV